MMCMSDAPWPTLEDYNKIHFCPSHPKVSLGRCHYSHILGYSFEHYCPYCILFTIAALPERTQAHPDWYGGAQVDLTTIQLIFDIMDQKFGLTLNDPRASGPDLTPTPPTI